mmetsp:Transcript_123668/g.361124  ORF Transcript_123668/g.361124 Transcript_123668/m.361124 type:complete len:226 (-) Transcript_123668:861-1538(-)
MQAEAKVVREQGNALGAWDCVVGALHEYRALWKAAQLLLGALANALEERPVLARFRLRIKAHVGVRYPGCNLPGVHVREAVTILPGVQAAWVVRILSLPRVCVTNLACGTVINVPAPESNCIPALLTHLLEHCIEVSRCIDVVVIKVGNVHARRQVCTHIALEAKREALAEGNLNAGIHQPCILTVAEEWRWLLHPSVDHDKLFVMPGLLLEAAPDLFMKVVPRL